MKNIYATISNHVQMVGYREIVEAHGRARGLAGLVFNDVDGSVKVMASGPEPVLTEFIHDLKIIRPDTVIETKEIMEDIRLPSPFGRITMDEMREISERLDKGNMILGEINLKLTKLDIISDKLDTLGDKFDVVGDKLDTFGDKFDVIGDKLGTLGDKFDIVGDKLDTLPERLAEAMKK